MWTAAGLGLAFAASVLTKLSALGLAPGFACALALLAWRERRGRWVAPVVAGALAAAVPIVPLLARQHDRVGSLAAARRRPQRRVRAGRRGGHHVSGFFSYLWQYVLPPTGSMTNFFGVEWLPKDFWTPMWVGKFGWFDYQFPPAVNHAAFALYVLIAVAALAALILRGRRDWALAVLFAIVAGGLCGAIAKAGYQLRVQGNTIFEQARYLMPLLALYAFAVALAVSLLRRRAELAVIGLLAGASAVHLLGAFILTVRRYYL